MGTVDYTVSSDWGIHGGHFAISDPFISSKWFSIVFTMPFSLVTLIINDVNKELVLSFIWFVNQFSQLLAVTCLRKFATKHLLYFPPHLICMLLLYLVTRAESMTNVHSCRSDFLRTPIFIENPDE